MNTARVVEKEGFAALALRLRGQGIKDIDLLTAVEQTPRTLFVPPQFAGDAYSSRLLPIDCGSFVEGVDLAVRLLHLLNLKSGQRVLEIGTGSGFTAAVMGRLTERVLTVDRYRTLVTGAQQGIEKAGIRNVVVRQADGSNGMPGEGTFDRILVTAAFPAMPRLFAEQLVSGGMLLAPVMMSDTECRMLKLVKTGSRFDREDLFEVPYLPIVPHLAQAL
ncbi:protein-L-isoaspartate(D-aspartate) O-methyltransferase [Rhizobium sp. TRM96647]|uniref:protein-L-isoaspartate(D-aspartate) O-methyltransferase n=1 Tax=unclassified Rhizobium TaxID=2613769 RepID=UPI0021E9056A|nr:MULTISPECIES: protein-L-isoaspartate(D-aspartate) O-methyltransferase [unclassified Rhizobium]MCV3737738.1 protein-L-isoaspartate(D-aspartate) O-methyltransferase [Rhizobium sp. TRM96647]MCV3759532.1 protein-L-isoaspartate(D-aspartate) O-methyltransferase [Rhizobium sp. TRM96650]